jgi:hypothetical protein
MHDCRTKWWRLGKPQQDYVEKIEKDLLMPCIQQPCFSDYWSLRLSKIDKISTSQNVLSNFIQGKQYPAFRLSYYLDQDGANQLINALVKSNYYQGFTNCNITDNHISSLNKLSTNQLEKLCQMFGEKQKLALQNAPKPKVISKHTGTLNSPLTIASQSPAKRPPARSLPKLGSKPQQTAPKPMSKPRRPAPKISLFPTARPPYPKKTPRPLPNSTLQSSPRTAVIANCFLQQQTRRKNTSLKSNSKDEDEDYKSSEDTDSSLPSEEYSPAEDAATEESQVSPAKDKNIDSSTNEIEEEKNDNKDKSENNMPSMDIEAANDKSNDIEAVNNKNESND